MFLHGFSSRKRVQTRFLRIAPALSCRLLAIFTFSHFTALHIFLPRLLHYCLRLPTLPACRCRYALRHLRCLLYLSRFLLVSPYALHFSAVSAAACAAAAAELVAPRTAAARFSFNTFCWFIAIA